MQVDNQKITQTANQYCNCQAQVQPESVINQPQTQPAQQYDYQYYQYPQNNIYPQAQPQSYTTQPAGGSAVNIQIFNPAVTTPGAQAPTYNVNAPNNYPNGAGVQNTHAQGCQCPQCQGGNNGTGTTTSTSTAGTNQTSGTSQSSSTTTTTNTDKKTEKKKVVQLTDEYIRNLENYLNSQDKEVRLNGAKEVFARLEEDTSRKDDKALTALINKMLQDPSEEIKLLALTALDTRIVTGDDYTKNVLEKMQATDGGFGQDAIDASKILLQMSGKQIEKEVPVTETKKTETKTEKTESRKE